ncbi:hypothetical protein [Paenibacillus alvei]|nr:hypothetical protein [Paenibacillus alvei]
MANINVTIKKVPHPNNKALIDLWASLVVSEIQKKKGDKPA